MATAIWVAVGCGGRTPSTVEQSQPDPVAAVSSARSAEPVAPSSPGSRRCVPVASCQVFPAVAGDECALVRADGTVALSDRLREAQLPADFIELDRACPGDPGVGALSSCLEFIELRASCYYRPLLTDPGYRCVPTGTSCTKTDA